MNILRIARRCSLALATCALLCSPAAPSPGAPPALHVSSATTAPVSGRDVEPTVWFQGFLADAGTSEPIDAVYNINASIYALEVGGSPMWGPELHRDVSIVDGWFNIELGAVTPPLPDFSTPGYYLELEVNGEVLSPRSKLASVPMALLSSESVHADDDWTIDGDDVYHETGNVGIGTATPGTELDVDGTIRTSAFQLTSNPSAGRVLTSDASGVGTWQPASSGIGGSGTAGYLSKFSAATTIGNSAAYESGGSIGIGTTTTSSAKLTVASSDVVPTVHLTKTSTANGVTILNLLKTDEMHALDDLLRIEAPQASTSGSWIHCYATDQYGFTSPFIVYRSGEIYSQGGAGFVDYTDASAVRVDSYYGSDLTKVVHAVYGGGGTYNATAVYGESKPADGFGTGGWFEGGYNGLSGTVNATGSANYYGVYGGCGGGTGVCYGVNGGAFGGGTNFAVYGYAALGTTNWSGYFAGNVRVTGSLVNPMAELEIDDPTDPVNGYLRHPYVSSSEMKTVYDGTVVLDPRGEAWVEMPDWCEALNGEFRYQLTPLGSPAPNLYVADEVDGGRFRIAGGEPGMKVCWMLTGVRRDPTAASRGSEVRVPKTGDDIGRYLDPAAYGAPESQQIGRNEDKEWLH